MQLKVIQYLLKKVFPQCTALDGSNFLQNLKRDAWNVILFSQYYDEDLSPFSNPNSMLNKLKTQLDELLKLDPDDDEIGDKLVCIFFELCRVTKKGFIVASSGKIKVSLPSEDIPHYIPAGDSLSDRNCDEILSSNILAFLKWIPIPVNDVTSSDLMKVITDIIEAIPSESYVFLAKKLEEQSTSDFFLLKENVEYRKLLLPAVHNNRFIHNKFHELLV